MPSADVRTASATAHAHNDPHAAASAAAAAKLSTHEASARHDELAHDDQHGHADPHADAHEEHHGLGPGEKPHETGLVITLPLILLAIPSLLIGFFTIGPMLYGDWFKGVIFVGENHPAMEKLGEEFHGALTMGLHGFVGLPFWLALAGVVVAWYLYLVNPKLTDAIEAKTSWLYALLDNKYYLDRLYEIVFAAGGRRLGRGLWRRGDQSFIDGFVVNGSARFVGWFAGVIRTVQSGYIYHYAFAMIIGVLALMSYFVLRQPLH